MRTPVGPPPQQHLTEAPIVVEGAYEAFASELCLRTRRVRKLIVSGCKNRNAYIEPIIGLGRVRLFKQNLEAVPVFGRQLEFGVSHTERLVDRLVQKLEELLVR